MSVHDKTMLKCKTFEEWTDRHIRIGDTEKYRKDWDALHNVEAPKPKRKRRTKAEMEAADDKASD